MQNTQQLQINVGHLKTEMVKKLGAERSKIHFFYLSRFLSLKITKVEFNKICFRVLGKENIVLHNQLISSILRNAYHAKAPPEINGSDESGGCDIPIQRNELQQSNAVRSQSGSHERANKTADLSYVSVLESEAKLADIQQSRDEQIGVCKDSTGAYLRRCLQAPLGVPISAVRTGGARGAVASNKGCVSLYNCGELLDSMTLKHSMEQIAMSQGLQGVSLDSSNLLNNALDCYLKSLIRSSIEKAGNGSLIHSSLGNTFSNEPQVMLQAERPMNNISLLDFRVAMELNPQRLGEDWPLLLEKTCSQSHME